MVHPVETNIPLAIAPVCNSLPILERTSNQLASWPLRVKNGSQTASSQSLLFPQQRTFHIRSLCERPLCATSGHSITAHYANDRFAESGHAHAISQILRGRRSRGSDCHASNR
jgi:hypothetical protein